MLKALGILFFGVGLLLAIRVMFFGVARQIAPDRLIHRKWPAAAAAALLLTGLLFYLQHRSGGQVTILWSGLVAVVAVGVAVAAWLFVKRSAALPSGDPDDDPRFRFQGHVARIVEPMESRDGAAPSGSISFEYENRPYVMRAYWSPESTAAASKSFAPTGDEVVIEFVDGDVAFVEPWAMVEKRL